MVSHRSFLAKAPAVLALSALLLVLPGCPLSPDSDNGGGEPTRLDERNTIQGTLNRLAQVWEQKNYTELEKLLHDQYEYFIRDDDADEFPWLGEADSWGRTTELGFAANMFDANFTGESPPVDSITWDFDILLQRDTVDNEGKPVTEVTTDAIIQVLTGPNDGWRSDTRFIFDIVADPQAPGLFQIKTQREVRKL